MNKCVIDCSVSAAWLLKDEYKRSAEILLEKIISGKTLIIQPDLWWYESMNLLKSSFLRKRIEYDDIKKSLFFLKEIPMTTVKSDKIPEHLWLENTLEFNLSAYDSAYLTLAQVQGAELLTYDKQLLKLKKKLKFISKP